MRIILRQWIIFGIIALFLFGSVLAVSASPAAGITVTVNRTSDASDLNPGDGICDVSANVGDQCSLRAAFEELNALGPDTTPHHVEFNISGTGPFTITPGSALPTISVPVTINGETQPGAACPTANSPAHLLIVLEGSLAGASTSGLVFDAGSDGSTLRGMVIGNFTNTGVRINSASNNIRCNHIGLGVDGNSDMGNGSIGIILAGNNNTIGGQSAHAQRNVISGNEVNGIRVEGGDNLVANNFIGVTADGLSARYNTGGGIYVAGDNNTIGSNVPLGRNVISGNIGYGIRINNAAANVVLGNLIGVARDGVTPLPNVGDGVEVVGAASLNVIGGVSANEANLIAHNGLYGVRIDSNIGGMPLQNTVRGNTIYDHVSLGIDLGGDGVDINDAGDVDGDENEHQNYPVLSSVSGNVNITGALDSQASRDYQLDFYRNDSCDASGYGEGQEYLGTLVVTTNGSGHVDFVANLAASVFPGDSLTATATDPDGNTSEFSACLEVPFPDTPTPTSTSIATSTPTSTGTVTPGPSPTPTITKVQPTIDLTEFPATPTVTQMPGVNFWVYLSLIVNSK